MQNYTKIKVLAAGLLAISMLTACNDDDNDGDIPGYRFVGEITFENSGITLAGPTSYGANLYSDYSAGNRFTNGSIAFNHGADAIKFGLNTNGFYPGEYTLYNGGMFLSQFNIRENAATQTGSWWYSYNNQCSVYNVDSANGSNHGAGDDGSDTFAIINGCCDENAVASVFGEGKETTLGGFSFDNNAEFLINEIEVCNTSYVYGTIVNGNEFSASLAENDGWLKVLAYGYDAQGQITNGGRPVEYTICDYRQGGTHKVIDDDWEDWNLSQLGLVNRVVFNFVGSDASAWGLNTPAYLAIDNIEIFAKTN